jgi:hypothetical protein
MIGIGIVVEAGDFDPAGRSVSFSASGRALLVSSYSIVSKRRALSLCLTLKRFALEIVDRLLDLYNDRAVDRPAESLQVRREDWPRPGRVQYSRTASRP